MNDINKLISDLKRYHAQHPFSAQQNLAVSKPARRQLHRFLNNKTNPEFFWLVTDVEEESCQVVPGSLDGIMAGPTDLVMPKSVLGQYIFLSPDLACSIPASQLGIGFAALDNASFQRALESLEQYRVATKEKKPSYPSGLPYLSKLDSRKAYHQKLKAAVLKAQENKVARRADVRKESSFILLEPLWELETSVLAAGTGKHDIAIECHPYGRSEFVSIVFSPNEKELRVNIYTPDQSEPSPVFDSWELVSENGSVLGTLRNGFCIVHDLETFDGKCGLRDPAGKRILCFEKREMV